MTVLCYHSVEPGWASPLALEPDLFEAHCAWLSRHRQVLPLETAVGRLDRSCRLPRGVACLTFDDGFTGVYDHALATLQRYRLPATVFLVAKTLTSEGQPVDWVDTPAGFTLTTLTREQVQELQEAGIDFQSHSLAHRDLTRLGYRECVRDLRESKEILESLLGRKVPFLAYPRGRHDAEVWAAARAAGYTHAFTLPESREPTGPLAIPRVGLHRGNGVRNLQVKSTRAYLPARTSPVFPLIRRMRAGAQARAGTA